VNGVNGVNEVFITCALTGAGPTTELNEHVPVTPAEIAASAIEAARAGASAVHVHVRDPQTKRGSRDPKLYAEVVERVAASGVDVVVNLTGGMGGALTLGSTESPLPLNDAGTDLVGAAERMQHVTDIRPEICTIDCGTMNWAGDPNYLQVHTQGIGDAMARQAMELGVRPEFEVFDFGNLDMVRAMADQGLIDDPILVQLCMGIRYGAPADLMTLGHLASQLPDNSVFSAFSIGRHQLPFVALAALAGGNVRVGLEDNLYLSRGVPATNAQLVQRAVTILEAMNIKVMSPAEMRDRLKLTKRW
jgi:uncharacterized protein (DUF849 family)